HRKLFDLGTEVCEESGTEVAHDVRRAFELVADQRQAEAKHVAIHDVLNAAQDGIDTVDHDPDLIEQTEVREAVLEPLLHVEEVKRNGFVVDSEFAGRVGCGLPTLADGQHGGRRRRNRARLPRTGTGDDVHDVAFGNASGGKIDS